LTSFFRFTPILIFSQVAPPFPQAIEHLFRLPPGILKDNPKPGPAMAIASHYAQILAEGNKSGINRQSIWNKSSGEKAGRKRRHLV
jgi:hypothetical protein